MKMFRKASIKTFAKISAFLGCLTLNDACFSADLSYLQSLDFTQFDNNLQSLTTFTKHNKERNLLYDLLDFDNLYDHDDMYEIEVIENNGGILGAPAILNNPKVQNIIDHVIIMLDNKAKDEGKWFDELSNSISIRNDCLKRVTAIYKDLTPKLNELEKSVSKILHCNGLKMSDHTVIYACTTLARAHILKDIIVKNFPNFINKIDTKSPTVDDLIKGIQQRVQKQSMYYNTRMYKALYSNNINKCFDIALDCFCSQHCGFNESEYKVAVSNITPLYKFIKMKRLRPKKDKMLKSLLCA